MTIDGVLDRVNTICASSPYYFRQAREPFGMEMQPAGTVDKAYTVGMQLLNAEPFIGWYQGERWEVSVKVARSVKDDAQSAYRQIHLDISSLTASLSREAATQSFAFEDEAFESEVIEPDAQDAFVVGELVGVVTFERTL